MAAAPRPLRAVAAAVAEKPLGGGGPGGGGGGPAPVEGGGGGGGGPAPVEGGGGGGGAPIGREASNEGPRTVSGLRLRRAAEEQVAGLPEAPDEELEPTPGRLRRRSRAEGRDMEQFHLDQRPNLAALIQQDAAHEDGRRPLSRADGALLGLGGIGSLRPEATPLSGVSRPSARGSGPVCRSWAVGLKAMSRLRGSARRGQERAFTARSLEALSRDKDLDQTTGKASRTRRPVDKRRRPVQARPPAPREHPRRGSPATCQTSRPGPPQ